MMLSRNWLAFCGGQGTGTSGLSKEFDLGKELAGSRRWARNWYLGPKNGFKARSWFASGDEELGFRQLV